MPRVERRHQEHAQQRRDAEVVPERRSQLHLLIVNELRHDTAPAGGGAVNGVTQESRDVSGEIACVCATRRRRC